jgi:uncharacterized protein (TIGR02270 family)
MVHNLAVTTPSSHWRPAIVPDLVRRHAEDAAILHAIRSSLVDAPHVELRDLGRFDERLAAHLDGLAVAGEQAWPFCDASLAAVSPGTVFTSAVRAIEMQDEARLSRLFALTEAVPESRPGLISAFGWVEQTCLKGLVANLLASSNPYRRMVGIAACAVHRVDPGLMASRHVFDASPLVRQRAFRTVGEIGCQEAASACASALRDSDPPSRFWAARSLVLLGEHPPALEVLKSVGLAPGPYRRTAFRLVLQAVDTTAAREILQQLAQDPRDVDWLILGCGFSGDPQYVPWLIGHMANDKTARLAGEAFTLITGADLSVSGLERSKPESFESGPTADPDDPSVEMDPQRDLPWPDVSLVQRWWSENAGRFINGSRSFVGSSVTPQSCLAVLRTGAQRHRTLAAHYLCLLEAGRPLFNTSSAAWRQERLLAAAGR